MGFRNKTVLILGGNSDVGKSLAREFGKFGSNLILTYRSNGQLDTFKSDLQIRYDANCTLCYFDVLDFNSHSNFYEELDPKPDIVISCIGYLNDQKIAEINFIECLKSIQSNYTGIVSILNIVADDFEKRGKGVIVGISSVAGDRGRQSNYIYGSAKAAFTTYLNGLRNRLYKSNVHVITVKPGFIKTKMTRSLDLPRVLTSTPDEVSAFIIKGIVKSKNILYVKWFWKYIMGFILRIPESTFKKLNL